MTDTEVIELMLAAAQPIIRVITLLGIVLGIVVTSIKIMEAGMFSGRATRGKMKQRRLEDRERADMFSGRATRAKMKQRRLEERERALRIYEAAAVDHDRVRDEYGSWLGIQGATTEKTSLHDVAVPETATFIEALADANDSRPDEKDLDLNAAEGWKAAVDRACAAWVAAKERAARPPSPMRRLRASLSQRLINGSRRLQGLQQ